MKKTGLTDVLLIYSVLIITGYATFIITDLAVKEAAEYDDRSSAICQILQVETRGSTSKYDILVMHNATTFGWTIYSQILSL